MRLVHCCLALLLCALSMVGALEAPARPVSLGAGGGVLFVDKNASTIVGSRGVTAFFWLSWRSVPLILDASVQNAPRNRDNIFPVTIGWQF